jgi:hypothetical protein
MALAGTLPVIAQDGRGTSQFVEIKAPNRLAETAGNAGLAAPFFPDGTALSGHPSRFHAHFQQVIAASEFARLPPGGAWLTRMFFRPDCPSLYGSTVTNLQVRFATTPRRPDALSPVFAENLGPDASLAYSSRSILVGSFNMPPCRVGLETSGELLLNGLFHYDPARGDLLVDIRRDGLEYLAPPFQTPATRFDAEEVAGDGVSHILTYSRGADTADVVSTAGLVLLFRFDYEPRLFVHLTNQALEVRFPLYPLGGRLQVATGLDDATGWGNYRGTIEQIGFDRRTRLPLGQLQAASYFRFLIPPATP